MSSSDRGYLYVMASETWPGQYMVGCSTNPEKTKKKFQTSAYCKIDVILKLRAGKQRELKFHMHMGIRTTYVPRGEIANKFFIFATNDAAIRCVTEVAETYFRHPDAPPPLPDGSPLGVVQFKCCGITFPNYKMRATHIRTVHALQINCNECDYTCAGSSRMQSHMRTHNVEDALAWLKVNLNDLCKRDADRIRKDNNNRKKREKRARESCAAQNMSPMSIISRMNSPMSATNFPKVVDRHDDEVKKTTIGSTTSTE